MKKIYFILTYSGTVLGRIIRFKTKRFYTHVSISLDENLEKMYSFGRINPYNCFVGGFVHERQNLGFFKRFKNTKAMICYIQITDYQYEKLEQQIKLFEENKAKYKFNTLGLIYIFLNKKDEVWYYTITTNPKKNPFTSEGNLLLIQIEKYWVMIRGNNARDFYIPCSILTKEELDSLNKIAQDYIIKNPQNEEKTNESI